MLPERGRKNLPGRTPDKPERKLPMKTMNEKRNAVIADLVEILRSRGEDVDFIASNKVNFPVVDSEGNEGWVTVTVSVPLGEGRGKEPYDGYGERQSYQMKVKEKAEKAAIAAEKKARKIAERKAAKSKKEEG